MMKLLKIIIIGFFVALSISVLLNGCAFMATGRVELPPPPSSENEWTVPGKSWSWGTAGGVNSGGGYGTVRGAGEHRRLRKSR